MAIRNKIPVVSLENFYEALFGRVSPEYAGNPSWALEHVLPKCQGLYPRIKRVLNLLIAGAAVAALAPLWALVYAAIKLVDGVPPIYGQRRVGMLGKEFMLWKFRTMAVNAEAAGPFASGREHAARVTRLGGWLRRFRLDELPQLWNVFKGEMSLVGPRPEWVKEVEVLEKVVPSYHLRHLVAPGITGWAQVYYRATSNPKDSIEKHHYDLYYLKYFSFALDCAILLKTLKRIFIKDSLLPVTNSLRPRFYGLTGRKLADLSSVIVRN
jgi:lipopolysaccharide/colanic/teichoic acid biosynthesis glycosyltransferase